MTVKNKGIIIPKKIQWKDKWIFGFKIPELLCLRWYFYKQNKTWCTVIILFSCKNTTSTVYQGMCIKWIILYVYPYSFKPCFSLSQVGSKKDVFPFIEHTLVHATYPHEWYQNELSPIYENMTEIWGFPGNIYTNDLYTKIVSPVMVRQVRVPESKFVFFLNNLDHKASFL